MKHNKLGLNHQNQNFVLIMTTDDGGGVLVLDVGWWETQGIVTEGFQIFLNLLKYFCFQIFSKPTCMRGGEKVGTKVTLEFILLLFSLSWILYTLLESILRLKTFLDTTSAACAACWLCWLQQQNIRNKLLRWRTSSLWHKRLQNNTAQMNKHT